MQMDDTTAPCTLVQIIDILRQRSLQTATLDDVYFGPGHNRHA